MGDGFADHSHSSTGIQLFDNLEPAGEQGTPGEFFDGGSGVPHSPQNFTLSGFSERQERHVTVIPAPSTCRPQHNIAKSGSQLSRRHGRSRFIGRMNLDFSIIPKEKYVLPRK
jgi:hypothetical protein